MKTKDLILHINVQMSLNENDSYSWSDPRVEERIAFEIPLDVFHSATFLKAFDKKLGEMEKALPAVIKKFQEEQEAKKLVEQEA